jgi:hypothetical protein
MAGREIFARDDYPTIDLNLMNNQSTNLDDWKRNLAREARPTTDFILIRNQSTCIEKGKPKTITK